MENYCVLWIPLFTKTAIKNITPAVRELISVDICDDRNDFVIHLDVELDNDLNILIERRIPGEVVKLDFLE